MTILDDDTKGITLSKSAVTLGESGSNTSTTYTVVLDSQPTGTVTVAVASAGDAVAKVHTGSNTPGESVDLTFTTSNWDDPQTVTVTAQDDNLDNSNQKRVVNITHTASGADYDGVTKSLPVTVNDDDGVAEVNLSLSPASIAEDAEGAQTITVTAAITGTTFDTDQAITIKVGESGTATKGTDYAEVSDFTITIAAREASKTGTFDIMPTSDDVDEDNETVEVSGTLSGITVNEATLTITDNDTKKVKLSKSAVTLDESGTNVSTYTVVLESEPTGTVTVAVASTATDAATVSPSSLTFEADNSNGKLWSTAQTVAVTGVPDAYDNSGNKRDVNITHTPSGGGYGSSETAMLPVSVTDDDGAAAINLSLNPTNISEDTSDAQTIAVTAAISNTTRFASAQTVAVTVGGGSATSARTTTRYPASTSRSPRTRRPGRRRSTSRPPTTSWPRATKRCT